ncbi:33K [Fowl aviadenovirus A]|nr:33K [Fowl aviadenovirus A]WNM87524.1 33K [Fowl aviadenovirus A]WNM87602.1 33K [Fowl aviadenovirus A]WNM87836.1 33K [Fowl aviadenovirus A]WNM87992.1 33K [Fowl aviadenovirus A]
MAQRMLDEKTRVTEAGPEVYGESARSSFHEEQEEDVSDGETLGSQDTTNGLTDISEEEEEEDLFEGNKENIPPPRRPPRNRRLRAASSLEEPLLPPSAATDKKTTPHPSSHQKNTGAKAVRLRQDPVPQHIADLRGEILDILLEIESYARRRPDRHVSIRNRTRESITRKLHYEKNEDKLTRMKSDAIKLLALWQTV